MGSKLSAPCADGPRRASSCGGCGMTPDDFASGSSGKSGPSDTVYLGGGCFWCVEAVFQRVIGVEKVVSGYMGGATPDPTYRSVCSGTTGHAEVVCVTFSPLHITLEELLDIFFQMHDPTTLNQQGNDIGTQYRSAIFCCNATQKTIAEDVIAKLAPRYEARGPIVTEVTLLGLESAFFVAEAFHQNYSANNPKAGYCRFVVAPKLKKVKHDKYLPPAAKRGSSGTPSPPEGDGRV